MTTLLTTLVGIALLFLLVGLAINMLSAVARLFATLLFVAAFLLVATVLGVVVAAELGMV